MAINKNILFILEKFVSSDSVLQARDIFEALPELKLTLRQIQTYIKAIKESGRITSIGAAVDTTYLVEPIQKPYKKHRFIFVYKDNERAGLLVQRADDYLFIYDSSYLIDNLNPIPTLPFSLEPIQSNILFPIFEENLPEGVNKDIMEISMRKTNDLDKLASLTHNIGDLHFSFSQKETNTGGNKGVRQSYLANIDKILGTNTFPNILKEFSIELTEEEIFPEESELTAIDQQDMSGISGFQYKKLMEINYEKHQIFKDELSRGYIFKPYSKIKATPNSKHYLPHLAINEHLFMTFAKNELGFNVPESSLVKREHDEEYHYLVKRFDRLGTQKYTKVTFATFLGLISETKYETSSEKMFKRIKKELKSKEQRMNLLKYYFYSMLIIHEDMHTKNLSLIFDGEITLLAPLYDIATTSIYPYLKGYESHIPVDGKRTNITPRCFKKLVTIMDIDYTAFKQEASSIIKAYIEILPKYFEVIDALEKSPVVYKMKRKVLRGTEEKFYKDSDVKEIPLSQLFLSKHTQRVEHLETLGWLSI